MLHLVSAGMPGAGIITSAWNGWIHLPASNFPGNQFLCLMIQAGSFTFRNFIPGNRRKRWNWSDGGIAKGMVCAELVFDRSQRATISPGKTWFPGRECWLIENVALQDESPGKFVWKMVEKNHSSGGIAFDLREINFLKSWKKKRCSNQIADCCTSLKVR